MSYVIEVLLLLLLLLKLAVENMTVQLLTV